MIVLLREPALAQRQHDHGAVEEQDDAQGDRSPHGAGAHLTIADALAGLRELAEPGRT